MEDKIVVEGVKEDENKEESQDSTIEVEKEAQENASEPLAQDPESKPITAKLGFFEKYLTIWVLLCMIVGAAIGYFWPEVADFFDYSYLQVSLPLTILLWVMIFPMTLEVDLLALKDIRKHPRGIFVTSSMNYLVQPFVVYGIAVLFFEVIYSSVLSESTQQQYVAGAVILGGAPCTAMVFVWSQLVDGDPSYSLVQVAINDILILIFYLPTLILLLNATNIHVPYEILAFSVFLFVVVPFFAGSVVKTVYRKSPEKIKSLTSFLKPFTIVALLLTLILIFIFQGEFIVRNAIDVVLISIPLTLQTVVIALLSYVVLWLLKVPREIAGPAGMIASSNFFELAVGVAISSYGADSGAALVCSVGVLTEVPTMLTLVWLFNRNKHRFRTMSEYKEQEQEQEQPKGKNLQVVES